MIVVLGAICTDLVVRGPRLPTDGENVRGGALRAHPGGKGANQAIAAARLDAPAGLIGRIGADERGETCLAQLRCEGVDTRHVGIDPEIPTGAVLIHVDNQGKSQSLSDLGANHRLTTADVRAAAPMIACAQWLLVQLGVPAACVIEALAIARAMRARVLLDPAPAAELHGRFAMADIVKPNAREAAALTGIEVDDRSTARRAAGRLLERGDGVVAIEAGPEGDLLVTRESEQLLPRRGVRSIDSTGAGDAYAAALAVMLSEGRTLREAGRFANAAAALATMRLGAQPSLPFRADVLSLLARVGGTASAGIGCEHREQRKSKHE